MDGTFQDSETALILFLAFLALSFAALITAWVQGRQWGDLSSRKHYGEALTEEEKKELKHSKQNFFLWAGASLVLAALSFFALR